MQTFLPSPNFVECARVLDYKRLGKQRVEAKQIIRAIRIVNGWSNHCAVKMWRGHTECLKLYMNFMIDEWIRRGYKNTMEKEKVNYRKLRIPEWMGDERLHSSHRANLIRKEPTFYSQYNWKEKPQEGYWWPYRRVNKEWVCYL